MQHQKLETSWAAHGDGLVSFQESKFMVKSLTKKRQFDSESIYGNGYEKLNFTENEKNRIDLLFWSGSTMSIVSCAYI